MALAAAFRAAMSLLKARVKPACSQTTARAVRSGSAIATFLGTSSPKIMDSAVASRRARVVARPPVNRSGTPSAARPGRMNEATAGSAM